MKLLEHLCPYPWEDTSELAERFYNKLELYNYYGSRSLCVVGTEWYLSSLKSGAANLNVTNSCIGWSSILIFMGPEERQEMQYPPDDKFDEEDPFEWLTLFAEQVSELNIKYKQEIKRAVEHKFELEELVEEINIVLEEIT